MPKKKDWVDKALKNFIIIRGTLKSLSVIHLIRVYLASKKEEIQYVGVKKIKIPFLTILKDVLKFIKNKRKNKNNEDWNKKYQNFINYGFIKLFRFIKLQYLDKEIILLPTQPDFPEEFIVIFKKTEIIQQEPLKPYIEFQKDIRIPGGKTCVGCQFLSDINYCTLYESFLNIPKNGKNYKKCLRCGQKIKLIKENVKNGKNE